MLLSTSCSLASEPYPGWSGSGCTSDEMCDDGYPCSIDSCDEYGVCHHENDDDHIPDDHYECTVDSCQDGRAVHDPTPKIEAPCGSEDPKMMCTEAGLCFGCTELTVVTDCYGPQFFCSDSNCRLKRDNGEPCDDGTWCKSAICTNGVCCNGSGACM